MVTVRSLQKWHGAGNDFLVDVQRPGEGGAWSPDLVRAICHRATGVGADGLIVAVLGRPVLMTLYNADGSLAEMSGNGARCLAAAVRRVTKSEENELEVQTVAGLKVVRLTMDSETSGSGSVDMGDVIFGDDLEGAWGVANVGNPHIACGTGSCAVAALARWAGLAGDVVTVVNPGGTLRVELDGSNATLSGPVQFIADVEWPEA